MSLPLFILVSCKELPKDVEVEERRDLCQYDDPTIYRNGYSFWLGDQPLSWRQVNATKFRLLNYAAGQATEIAVGQVERGSILENVNRWIGEFGQEKLQDISGLEKTTMLDGNNAYVIDLRGAFQTKFGGMPVKKEGWAVTGILCKIAGGVIVTVKMMGPEEEVMTEKGNLINFAKSIRWNGLQKPKERSEQEPVNQKAEGGY